MALLDDPSVVTDLLPNYDLPPKQLEAAMRLVASWLQLDAELAQAPESLIDGDPLFAEAFELTVLVATNPDLLASKTVGPTSRAWPIAQRRDAIRDAVRQRAQRAASGPRGSFPPPAAWPDPVIQPRPVWWVHG